MALTVFFKDGQKRYKGPSATEYQYDLSNQMDKLAYDMDVDAKMRDQISLNLNRKL